MNFEQAIQWQVEDITFKLKSAEDADGMTVVRNMIELVRPLWYALDHKHVADRLQTEFCSRAKKLIAADEQYLTEIRANDKTRGSTQANIRKLRELIDTMQPIAAL